VLMSRLSSIIRMGGFRRVRFLAFVEKANNADLTNILKANLTSSSAVRSD
jgi:hypothetical protein